MKTARLKGHTFEREIARQFQEMGFTDAKTTRAARGGDWSHTDDGTDLVGTEPFAVQCKRLQGYCSVNTIEEIKPGHRTDAAIFKFSQHPSKDVICTGLIEKIPLVLTKANNKETMAILPWSELKKLIRESFSQPTV